MNRKEELISHAGGTTFKEISKTVFRNFNILMPNQSIADKFYNICNNIILKIRTLIKQNVCLTQARDLLLPKFIENMIKVK